jgi:hypothetical protein
MTVPQRRAGPRRASGAVRQTGQALVWLLGTMAAAAAVMYGVYNIGQVGSAKQKAVNAADAAALAGATVQARVLNLVAYNNRSMIANEVLLVQMLSVESWLGYFARTADNIGTVVDIVSIFFPPIAAIGRALDRLGDAADNLNDRAVSPANDAIIRVLELAKIGFQGAHLAVINGGGLLAENAAARVVQANRAQFGVHEDAGLEIDNRPAVRGLTFLTNERQWRAFSRQYTRNQRTDARQVLLDSRDDFSRSRTGAWWTNWTVPCVGGLEKRGGSQLRNFDRWEAEDTLELLTPGKIPCVSGWRYTPIGWGRANADRDGSTGNRWAPNRTAQKNAWRAGRDHSHSGWTGVPAVYDISDRSEASRATLGLDFVVAVRRPQANTMTTQQIGMGVAYATPTGSAEMNERLESNQLSAISKARVSFERPQRGLANDWTASRLWRPDGAKEYGSLFSPYWQARVSDFSLVEKGALMTAMGINPALAPFTPGGQ